MQPKKVQKKIQKKTEGEAVKPKATETPAPQDPAKKQKEKKTQEKEGKPKKNEKEVKIQEEKTQEKPKKAASKEKKATQEKKKEKPAKNKSAVLALAPAPVTPKEQAKEKNPKKAESNSHDQKRAKGAKPRPAKAIEEELPSSEDIAEEDIKDFDELTDEEDLEAGEDLLRKRKKTTEEPKSEKTGSKLHRFEKLKKMVDEYEGKADARGVLYLGHLPYGFMEPQIREYFSQFGEVFNVKLFRSKKTGRSKGYAFIEFKFKEVALIAAKAMNGYIMYGKTMVCHPIEKLRKRIFKHSQGKFKYIPFKLIHRKRFNREKTPETLAKNVTKLVQKQEEKRRKLKEAGIAFNFPGYKEALKNKSASQ